MSSVVLPEDVIHEILLRLPAKSILNCMFVCKTWFSLISNPSFAKQHLDHAKKRSKFMFMIKDDSKPYSPLVSTVSYDDTLSSSFLEHEDYVDMDLPLHGLAYSIHMLGSCNGLICIMFQTCAVSVDEVVNFPVIWNPTTREYKILPISQTRFKNRFTSIYSFAYDRKNDDYKLLKGEFCEDDYYFVKPPPSEDDVDISEVYSLRSDSWRSIETIPYHMLRYVPYDTVSGVLVNGHRHWLANRRIHEYTRLEEFIVSFDFSEDKFKQMHLPKAFKENRDYCHLRTVGVLEECLCVINGFRQPNSPQLEIWVMQDYGVPESWIKRFVIHPPEARMPLDHNPLKVVWSFKDDNILLLKRKDQLVLYDPKQDIITRNSSSVEIRGVENYVESLVSLNSGIYVGSCREYANILRASWTRRLHLFDYESLVELSGMTLLGLLLAMGSIIFFKTQTMRKRVGQFVMVLFWLNSGEFKLWWWRVIQPADLKWWIHQRLLVNQKIFRCNNV